MYLILFSLVFSWQAAFAYEAQELKPVHLNQNEFQASQAGRTYNYHDKSRILASKKASFPILDQYEALLFPQKDFKEQKPKERLGRIEIAVHGDIQKGSIKHRLNLLENEITAWQIANYQTLEILNQKQNSQHAYTQVANNQVPQRQPNVRRMPQQTYRPQYRQSKKRDYDYENYRMASPIIKDIGRRSVRALFEL